MLRINIAPEAENLTTILSNELDSFKAVLQFSEKLMEQIETLPISALSQMVEYRKKWIEEIQEMEKLRRKFDGRPVDEESQKLIQNISGIAQKLVTIDSQIFKHLKERKLKFIKEHADLIAARRQNNKKHNGTSRIMDILQE